MHRPTLARYENPQQLKTDQEATMPRVSPKIGTEICLLLRQHSQHLKMLIQMQTGQLVIMLLVSFNTLNDLVSFLLNYLKLSSNQ